LLTAIRYRSVSEENQRGHSHIHFAD